MIPREPVPSKPQLEPQVGGRHKHAHLELANVKLVAFGEARASLLLEHQLVLLDPFQVALDTAKLCDAGYIGSLVSGLLRSRRFRSYLASNCSAEMTARFGK